jgi:3-hydroxyacyl-CoA dehydrogenase
VFVPFGSVALGPQLAVPLSITHRSTRSASLCARILAARGKQSDRLLLEGALPQQIDRVMYDFGLPMGPYAMSDMAAGIELRWRRRQETGESDFLGDRLAELGRFGQKVGKGYYRYEPNSREPLPDPEVEEIIREASCRQGIERREISDQEILERLLYPMINEGAKILEEGIAIRPSDIDVIWVYGYGWPTYRGGPMYYADSVGVPRILDRLFELQALHGDFFRPAALLNERPVRDGVSRTGKRSLPRPPCGRRDDRQVCRPRSASSRHLYVNPRAGARRAFDAQRTGEALHALAHASQTETVGAL